VGADDEIFLELAQARRGFWISNGQRNGDHDLRYPRFAWSRYTKLDILCNVALKVIKEFSYIELTDILPKHWSFWMTPS
jgi:hypothetical protein